jgi:tRNA-specific 2-thiouridylase
VVCNRTVKFGALYEKAMAEGCDALATGHYARLEPSGSGDILLKKAADSSKDQSYFLWSLPKELLPRLRFPLGSYTKPEIRAIAEEHGFVNARKRDSQDICFVKDGDYATFIEGYTGKSFAEGDFIDREGKPLGKHKGMIRYTVGQRKGLGIALGRPMFVCAKSAKENTVTLGENEDLFSLSLTARDASFVSALDKDETHTVLAKVRNTQKEVPATLTLLDGGRFRVDFEEPQRAISRGQSVVLYRGDTVLGGGIIE